MKNNIASRGLTIDAQGGTIKGVGTPTSDSIDALVKETGEPITVSTDERIVSKAQGLFLERVAKAAGYENLDAMLEDGTGKPVGPTIKAGKRAAADGMAPAELDPFAFRGGQQIANSQAGQGVDGLMNAALAAAPTLSGPIARSEPAGVLTGPAAGVNPELIGSEPATKGVDAGGFRKPTSEPGITKTIGAAGVSPLYSNEGSAAITVGSTAKQPAIPAASSAGHGISAAQAVNPIAGIVANEGLQRTARANQIRGEMIDSMIKADGGNGVAVLKDRNAEWNDQMRRQGEIQQITDAMARNPHLANAMSGALAQTVSGHNQQAAEAFKQKAVMAGLDIQKRGLDVRDAIERDRVDTLRRGQDMRATSARERIDSSERIADMRANESQLTLPQSRTNQEIEAARQRLAGMDPAEIKRRTANFTATGRENPDFDPTLAKAQSLAQRRMYGEDADFDSRQQPDRPTQSAKPTFTADDVKAAIAGGADPNKVADRIRSLGGNPADHGL